MNWTPRHDDAVVDRIADRADAREERRARRDENHLGRAVHSERLKYSRRGSTNRERAFARVWFRRNRYWASILGVLLSDDRSIGATGHITPKPHRVTKREADVAATVVQWLATNVGFCFLEDCLRESVDRAVKIEKGRPCVAVGGDRG